MHCIVGQWVQRDFKGEKVDICQRNRHKTVRSISLINPIDLSYIAVCLNQSQAGHNDSTTRPCQEIDWSPTGQLFFWIRVWPERQLGIWALVVYFACVLWAVYVIYSACRHQNECPWWLLMILLQRDVCFWQMWTCHVNMTAGRFEDLAEFPVLCMWFLVSAVLFYDSHM